LQPHSRSEISENSRQSASTRRLECTPWASLVLVIAFPLAPVPSQESAQKPAEQDAARALNRPDDGYRGIWYYNQKSNDEYVYKYSGGLSTYCAKHQPFAIYCKAVDKTFFCYGGTTQGSFRKLHHMVSYYDHKTGQVPRPTILLDKATADAHDNPVISMDSKGHIWIFSTSHGRSRPSYVHRSTRPYHIDTFERVMATYLDEDGESKPLTNFSYMQVWQRPGEGFVAFFTHYSNPADRTSMFMHSADGLAWSKWQRLAAIEKGHYQISAARDHKAACAFNYHPAPKGLNWRTNLYYMATMDAGKTWQTAAGQRLSLPITKPQSAALVHDYEADQRLVYLKDLRLDGQGHPVILYITSKGFQSGPGNNPRRWKIARWNGEQWLRHRITTSDNNYDMGSLYIEGKVWRVIGPTQAGPQAWNPGGEMVMWTSRNRGETWLPARQLTSKSQRNHTYARRPVNAHPDFFALWADGHGRQPSKSQLYFSNRSGQVFLLPPRMTEKFARPILIDR